MSPEAEYMGAVVKTFFWASQINSVMKMSVKDLPLLAQEETDDLLQQGYNNLFLLLVLEPGQTFQSRF